MYHPNRTVVSELVLKTASEVVNKSVVESTSFKSYDKSASAIFDELDFIETLMKCERDFNMTIQDELAEDFKTIKDLVDYIYKQIK